MTAEREPFFVGALVPDGVECDYFFDSNDGFYRLRHGGQEVERWTGNAWVVSELLTEDFAAGGDMRNFRGGQLT